MARIYSAGQKLSYSGVMVYQAGERSETSRIVHVFDAGHELEKLESLDGSPREVIRKNDVVKCYLPRQKTLIVDQAGNGRGFPSRLVAAHGTLSEHYRVSLGEMDRVAGRSARQVRLSPKDDLRFGLELWADGETGLLLKARMLDASGGIIEQFSFTEVSIGAEIDRAAFHSQFDGADGWRIIDAKGSDVADEGIGWRLASAVPGFRMTSAVRRQLGDSHGDVVHMVFSDGLASMSVFIEPLRDGREPELGASHSGPVSIYARRIGDFLVTSLGEAPPKAVQVLAEAVEATRP
ncbi:MAG: MucB/RseB C-terminal domain-containing protein [Rhodocyclaceae bacterium]|nr:MucB/RseB C-terminal domain-containing protein [Rhodocyclaceae bacterium]